MKGENLMKKRLSIILAILIVITAMVPAVSLLSATTESLDNGNIKIESLEFAYALRGTKDNVSVKYDEDAEGFYIDMPSNSKHVFLVSNTKPNGGTYTVSIEYKITSTDGNAMFGFVLGASRNDGAIDLKTGYKLPVYKASDRFRFSACDNNDPAAVGGNVSFDKNVNGAGTTYKANEWNTMSMTVTEQGEVSLTVNGVKVYTTTAVGYIDGYVGLYTYVAGTQIRNFNIVGEVAGDDEEPGGDDSNDIQSNISFDDFVFGYALRATADQVSFVKNEAMGCYDLEMPGNSKHLFMVSNTKSNGKGYKVTLDYQTTSTDGNAMIGIVLGIGRDGEKVDFTNAYKAPVYKASDRFRISSCDGATPDIANGSISFDKNVTGAGVTYKDGQWNTMSITVTEQDEVTLTVNGVEVYKSTIEYIDGYVGIYSYVPGTKVRNFDFTELADDVEEPGDETPDDEDSSEIQSNISLNDFVFGHALRATADQVSFVKNEAMGCYDLEMPGNSKHLFMVSNTKSNGKGYKVTLEYQSTSTDGNAMVGIVLGIGRDGGKIDFSNAYKAPVYKASDRFRLSSCDGDTPDIANGSISFDRNVTGSGVTYKEGQWNTMSMTVTEKGEVTLTVNGVKVYKSTIKYIDGYVGIYSYVPGTKVRSFNFEEIAEGESDEDANNPFKDFKFAHALRATADVVSISKNETTGGYNINMPGNSKHLFLVSNTKTSGKGYTVSIEYQSDSTDGNAMFGFVLGVNKSNDTYDFMNAYKCPVYLQSDRFRFSACDGATPDIVGGSNVSFDRNITGSGVTYKKGQWNTMSMTVTQDGIVSLSVNGVEVYKIFREYISGYIGLYNYVPGTQIRNFKFTENKNDVVIEENTNAKFLYNFAKQNTIYRVQATNDTNVEYDSTMKAMKVSIKANGEARFYLGRSSALPDVGVKCSDYPVIAMRVKLNNANSINGLWHYGTSTSGGLAQFSNAVATNYEIPYQKTTEWQTIIVNTSEIKYGVFLDNGATWEQFSFRMFDSAHASAENDVVWVQWVAGFASEQEALEYSGVVTDEFKYVAVVGDGLTTGVKAYTRNTYPVALQTKLGRDFYVKQFATMGATAANFLNSAEYNASVKYNPDIVVIMLGTNDTNNVIWKNAKQYKKDITSLINAYKSLENNPTIYLCTTPYIFDEIAPTSLSNSRVKEIVKIQKEVAKELGIILIDTYDFLEEKQEYYFNGLYLNNFGYPAMGNFIAEKILSTNESKVKEYIFKLDTEEAINNQVIWNNQNDTEVVFDVETGTLKVIAKDATTGSAADGTMATNVAGFTLKLPQISTAKYPVLALHIKLNDSSAMAGWFKFTTTDSNGEFSAKRPIYDATNEWQTIILDFSDPEQNTMISAFAGNWQSVTLNLGADVLTLEGTSFNVDWAGLFQNVDEARAYAGLKPLNNENEVNTNNGNEAKQFNHLVWIIPVCIVVLLGAGISIILIIKKRRLSK